MSVSSANLEAAQRSLCFAVIDSLKQTHLLDLRAKVSRPALPTGGSKLADLPALFSEFTQYVQSRQVQGPQGIEFQPFLTDALKDLPDLLKARVEEEASHTVFITFWEGLKAEATQSSDPGTVLAAEETVGKLIFLLDQEEVAPFVEAFKTTSDKTRVVKEQFQLYIEKAKKQFDSKTEMEKKVAVVDGDAYRAYELPKRLSNFLITSTGFFNTKIADALLSTFHIAPETHIAKMLKNERISVLKALVDSTAIPEEDDDKSWEFIFQTLDMPLDTDRDALYAKFFHLSAQLSRLWENKLEAFHATTTGNLIKSLHPEHFARDLNDWLRNGSFIRQINGVEEEFTFEDVASLDALKKEISVRKDGSLVHLDGRLMRDKISRLSDSEALSAAIIAMGFEKAAIPREVQNAITRIATKEKVPLTITPEKLILELGQSFPEAERESAIATGKIAFVSMTTNLAVSAWEQALIDMARTRNASLTHGKVLRVVFSTLYDQLKPQHVSEVEPSSSIAMAFLVKLDKKITHVYDKAAHAFVMPKVDSPTAFRDFVITTLDSTVQELVETSKPSSDDQTYLGMIVSRTQQFITDGLFLTQALQKFDPETKGLFLPWRAEFGNNPFELMNTYAGEESKVKSFTAEKADGLLGQILAFAKEKKDELSNQHALFALARAEHAFTLNPAIVKWEDVTGYLQATQALTFDRPLTPEERTAIARIAKEHLINKEVVPDFQTQVDALDPKLSLKEYRDAIAKISASDSVDVPEKALRMLDSYITKEAMPADFLETISPYIIRVATTDMFEGDKRLELCFFPDPISREMRLGLTLPDRAALRRLNQKEWVINQSWDLYSTKVDAS